MIHHITTNHSYSMVIIISGSYTMQCFWYDRADWENSTIEELFPTSPLVMKQKWHFTERYRNAPFRTIQLTTTEEVIWFRAENRYYFNVYESLISIGVNLSNDFQILYGLQVIALTKGLPKLINLLSMYGTVLELRKLFISSLLY